MVKGIRSLKKNISRTKSKKKKNVRISGKTKYFKFRLYTNNSFVKYNKIKVI
jgi:hypothetical protein